MVEQIKKPDVTDVKEFVTKQERNTLEFRQALDDAMLYYTLTYFTLPNYTDSKIYTSPLPRVFSDKITEELSYGIVDYSIPIDDSDNPLRTAESLTERAAYSFHRMVDENLVSPFSPVSQQQIAWFIPNTGYVAGRYWMYEDEEKKIVHDLAIWDIRNTYWSLGKRGRLGRVCYVRYASKDEIDEEYNIDSTVDEKGNGMVKVYDDWVRSGEEITVGKGKLKKAFYPYVEQVTVGDEMVKEMNTKKDYLPIYIASVGSMPLIQRNIDMVKYLPQTCFSKGKDMWKAQSELITYRMKHVRMSIMTPFVDIFNSAMGGEPMEIDKTPYKEGARIKRDLAKGQDVKPFFQPMSNPDAAVVEAQIAQWESMTAAPDILYGRVGRDLTAQGTAMLIHAGMGVLKGGQRAMEKFYTWFANEAVRQYKESGFNEIQIQGVDGKGKQFSKKINRDSLTTERQLVAALTINTPQDTLQTAGILHQYLADGVFSLQRAMDEAGVQDVDAEKEIRAREKLENAVPFVYMATLDALIKDRDPAKQQYAMLLMKIIQDAVNQLMMSGQQEQNAEIGRAQPQSNQPGIVAAPNPAANVVPPEARNMTVKPGQNNPKVRG